jgi:hypothetical protein
MSDYPFTTRLAILLLADIIITVADSFVPQDWTPLRVLFATIQLGLIAYTMAVAIKRVMQDY